MRRILGLVTVFVAIAALTGFGGATASAATGKAKVKGTLYVSNIPYPNPGGCKNGAGSRIQVRNDTNVSVRVHLNRRCTGPVMAILDPGEVQVVIGASVFIG